MRFNVISALLPFAPLAAAHGAVTSYSIGSRTYPGYDGYNKAASTGTIQRQWSTYDPVMKVTDSMVLCNGGTSAPANASIKAGQNITAIWKQWTHQQGPVMVWMYDCGASFTTCNGSGSKWFKIDQAGMWGTVMNSANWATATIYKNLKSASRPPSPRLTMIP